MYELDVVDTGFFSKNEFEERLKLLLAELITMETKTLVVFLLLFAIEYSSGGNSKEKECYTLYKNCIYHTHTYSTRSTRLGLEQFSFSEHRHLGPTQINRLQAIQNALAHAVTKIRKRHHVTPVLKTLHALKIPEQIENKAISLAYNTLQPPALPLYTRELFTNQPSRSFLNSS